MPYNVLDGRAFNTLSFLEYFPPGHKNREAERRARFGRAPATELERWRKAEAKRRARGCRTHTDKEGVQHRVRAAA